MRFIANQEEQRPVHIGKAVNTVTTDALDHYGVGVGPIAFPESKAHPVVGHEKQCPVHVGQRDLGAPGSGNTRVRAARIDIPDHYSAGAGTVTDPEF